MPRAQWLPRQPPVRTWLAEPACEIAGNLLPAVPLEIQECEDDLRKYLQERIARAHRLIQYVCPDQDLKMAIVDTVLGNALGM